MKMKLIIWIYLIPTVLSLSFNDNEDCWTINNNTITKKYAILVNFSPKFNNEKDICSVQISNPWSTDMQNGFGVFLPHPVDCSSIVTIECLPGGTFFKEVILTCYTNSNEVEMPCNSIGLTFKRNNNIQESKKSTNVQVVALAKEPCMDKDILFQCPQDYSHSCIDRKLQCNGRLECPSGDDERGCQHSFSTGVRIIRIILAVLAFLFFICILSTVLICCCCRKACNAIVHRFYPAKNEKGKIPVITGEDAGLMKGLTTPHVIEVLPQQHTEPTTLIIDSTKPVYPRLE